MRSTIAQTAAGIPQGDPPAEDARSSEPIAERYRDTRSWSERICEPLSPEDMQVQATPDASPAKWHLAHTSWFFERFVLRDLLGRGAIDDRYEFIFNSYYNAVGPQHARPSRGVLSRPSVREILEYRARIDAQMSEAFEAGDERVAAVAEIGINHEQQHQELMLTDIKLALWKNPLRPAYREAAETRGASEDVGDAAWLAHEGGVTPIGHEGAGFAYDNERPAHRVFLEPFEIADRLVTNGEYLAFVEDDGYARSELWLDAGWSLVRRDGLRHPIYWERGDDGVWGEFTLSGVTPLDTEAPVCGVSLFEADAFARWRGARLPTEGEWEAACVAHGRHGSWLEDGAVAPRRAAAHSGSGSMRQALGDCWEWTGSQYRPYPGFRPPKGAIGEYNGKFMCNQFVLRGGSFATPRAHVRPTYRNFFGPDARWQFAGVRLARDFT